MPRGCQCVCRPFGPSPVLAGAASLVLGVRGRSSGVRNRSLVCSSNSRHGGLTASNNGTPPLKVCIIGGGAAGLSAAWSLSRHPEFAAEPDIPVSSVAPRPQWACSLHVWDAGEAPGGVAATVLELGNGLFVNEQVQGGFEHSYANTLLLLRELGCQPHVVWPGVRLSVGSAARPAEYWDNFSGQDSFPVLQRHAAETKRFHKVMRFLMSGPGQALGLLPIAWLLRVLRFSQRWQRMVLYPLIVTLNGTGNQMALTPAAVVASILRHPILRVFGAGKDGALLAPAAQGPQLIMFPHLAQVYAQLAQRINASPGCAVCCSTPVTSIKYDHAANGRRWHVSSYTAGRDGEFDRVIFTCGPEATLRLLTRSGVPNLWLYRFVLSSYRVFDATIITHTDDAYMNKHYGAPTDTTERWAYWMVRWVNDENGRPAAGGLPQAELSYALSAVYDQLGKTNTIVYQTTLVDAPDIDPAKVISKRKARHVAMSSTSLVKGSLGMRLIQGRHDALFAGAYTMGNPHEAAVVTGLTAAERLGAPFPFTDRDADAKYYNAMVRAIAFGQGNVPATLDVTDDHAMHDAV